MREGLCLWTELPRTKVQLEVPLKLLCLGQPQTYWGRKGQEHVGRGWLRSWEGPWEPYHDDPAKFLPGIQGPHRVWQGHPAHGLSGCLGRAGESRATLSMGSSQYHLWPVKLHRRLGTTVPSGAFNPLAEYPFGCGDR